MNELEQALARRALAAPSADLDRRIAQAFAAAAAPRPAPRREGWWWPVAVASLAAIVVVLGLAPRPAPPSRAPIQVRLEPQGALRQLLLTPPVHRAPALHLHAETPST